MSFQRTSEIVGGGQVYSPAMLQYDGTTNYQTETFTPTGNKITEVLRFQVDPFLDATEQYRYIHRVVHTTYQRGSILVYPSDHPTVPNKLVCIVRDSTNTTLCYLVSTIDVCDSEVHNVLFAYDGDTGSATLIVDGQDVIDTGHVSHVLISGTIGTNSTDFIVGAYLPGPAYEFNGSHGFAGMSETYITDYNAFFTPDGQPIFQDTSDWASTGWGAQPRYWNPHGDFRNNLGSEGNATVNGQLLVGEGFEFPPHHGIATIGDINSNLVPYGKVGWANAQRYAGIHNPLDRGIIADYWVPINSAIATNDWDPSADFEGRLVVCNGLADQATTYSGKDWNRTATGCAYNATSYAPLVDLRNAPIPARILNLRRYYLEWMQFSAAVASANDGINFIVNFVDNSNFNFVQVILVGSQYQIRYIERVAGVDTTRSTITYSSIVDEPCYGWVMFDDWGDNIILSSGGFETDNAASDYSIFRNFYGAGGRPNKDGTGFYIGMGQVTTPARFGIRGFSVRELG